MNDPAHSIPADDAPSAPVSARFATFLAALQAHLRDTDQPFRAVLLDPTRRQAAAGEILIGVGSAGAEQPGVCLNNKAMQDRAGRPLSTVSDLVMSLDEADLAAARAKLGDPVAPAELLSRVVLVVEDISPDTCLALLAFLARMNGVAADHVPAAWFDYVRRWEGGDVLTTGEPFASWGALHNALSHSYLSPGEIEDLAHQRGAPSPTPPPSDPSSPATTDPRLLEGWRRGLLYLIALLTHDVSPASLPRDLPVEEHQRALAWLQQEEQEYLRSLPFATCVQLLLPVRGHTDRRLLVDAYLATERTALGAKKVFLRREREHTELKRGFGLMALYRPDLTGTGDDMVVSVDPATGTTLEALWQELERLENERWQGARPSDRPRRGVIAYSDAEGRPVPGAPNEPWYDTNAQHRPDPLKAQSYTLIAAPRRIDEHTLGTRLTWDDVVEALWRLYHPGRSLTIETDHGLCTLEECRGEVLRMPAGEPDEEVRKRLIVARWPRPDAMGRPESPGTGRLDAFPLFTSTLRRLLAACAARTDVQRPIALADLPEEAELDFLHLPGGIAVIHRRGVFLLDDWRAEQLRADELREELRCALKRLGALGEAKRELAQAMENIGHIAHRRRRGKVVQVLRTLTAIRVRIHKVLQDTETRRDRHEVRAFRQTMEDRWGIAGALADTLKAAKDAEDNLRAYTQARTTFLARAIFMLGFPLFVLSTWVSKLPAVSRRHIQGTVRVGEPRLPRCSRRGHGDFLAPAARPSVNREEAREGVGSASFYSGLFASVWHVLAGQDLAPIKSPSFPRSIRLSQRGDFGPCAPTRVSPTRHRPKRKPPYSAGSAA